MTRFASTVSAGVAMTLVSVAIAACGSSTPAASTSARRASRTSAQQSGLGYARCMRAHGVSRFPDPSATGGGFDLAAAGVNQSSPAVSHAELACRSLLPVKHVPDQTPTAASYARLVRWARCMRTHGISGLQDPKPDPPPQPNSPATRGLGTLMGDGGYWIGIPITVDAHSPAFMRLSTRCGESPSGHHG